MKKRGIETVKNQPKQKLVRDIQMLLDFINFYRRFIRNFNKIGALLTLILLTTSHKTLSPQAGENKKNQNALDDDSIRSVSRNIENLLTIVKLAKSKKLDFVKIKPSKTDFLIFKAKEAFIH